MRLPLEPEHGEEVGSLRDKIEAAILSVEGLVVEGGRIAGLRVGEATRDQVHGAYHIRKGVRLESTH